VAYCRKRLTIIFFKINYIKNKLPTEFNIEKLQLVHNLKKKGITDLNVLNAFLKVPRENFVPVEFINRSYEDCALPIDFGQTISQPYTVAIMTMLLSVQPNDKVLEIGTGSGYQAVILSEMGCSVYSIECILGLFEESRIKLNQLGYYVNKKLGDGTLGWIEESPFDRIIVTAGAPEIPKDLVAQLKIGGKMVIPVGDKQSQIMNLIEKNGINELKITTHHEFRFVPLIGEFGWQN
jgi:protein-L-isoaspartate(D-aspartate) O-methyltransferase